MGSQVTHLNKAKKLANKQHHNLKFIATGCANGCYCNMISYDDTVESLYVH